VRLLWLLVPRPLVIPHLLAILLLVALILLLLAVLFLLLLAVLTLPLVAPIRRGLQVAGLADRISS